MLCTSYFVFFRILNEGETAEGGGDGGGGEGGGGGDGGCGTEGDGDPKQLSCRFVTKQLRLELPMWNFTNSKSHCCINILHST